MPQSDQCETCQHFLGSFFCSAFPNKIPAEIVTGLVDHRKPYPGDNGIQWELFDAKKPLDQVPPNA